jgi:hypothetical protein
VRGDGTRSSPFNRDGHKLCPSTGRGPVSAGRVPPATPSISVAYQSDECAKPGHFVPRRFPGMRDPLTQAMTRTPPCSKTSAK